MIGPESLQRMVLDYIRSYFVGDRNARHFGTRRSKF